eukprot:359604-Chlamydomonas_euryale.AAC.2
MGARPAALCEPQLCQVAETHGTRISTVCRAHPLCLCARRAACHRWLIPCQQPATSAAGPPAALQAQLARAQSAEAAAQREAQSSEERSSMAVAAARAHGEAALQVCMCDWLHECGDGVLQYLVAWCLCACLCGCSSVRLLGVCALVCVGARVSGCLVFARSFVWVLKCWCLSRAVGGRGQVLSRGSPPGLFLCVPSPCPVWVVFYVDWVVPVALHLCPPGHHSGHHAGACCFATGHQQIINGTINGSAMGHQWTVSGGAWRPQASGMLWSCILLHLLHLPNLPYLPRSC